MTAHEVINNITAVLPDSVEILEPIGVYRPDIDSAQPAVNDWLDSLGYTQDLEGMNGETEDDSIQENDFQAALETLE